MSQEEIKEVAVDCYCLQSLLHKWEVLISLMTNNS